MISAGAALAGAGFIKALGIDGAFFVALRAWTKMQDYRDAAKQAIELAERARTEIEAGARLGDALQARYRQAHRTRPPELSEAASPALITSLLQAVRAAELEKLAGQESDLARQIELYQEVSKAPTLEQVAGYWAINGQPVPPDVSRREAAYALQDAEARRALGSINGRALLLNLAAGLGLTEAVASHLGLPTHEEWSAEFSRQHLPGYWLQVRWLETAYAAQERFAGAPAVLRRAAARFLPPTPEQIAAYWSLTGQAPAVKVGARGRRAVPDFTDPGAPLPNRGVNRAWIEKQIELMEAMRGGIRVDRKAALARLEFLIDPEFSRAINDPSHDDAPETELAPKATRDAGNTREAPVTRGAPTTRGGRVTRGARSTRGSIVAQELASPEPDEVTSNQALAYRPEPTGQTVLFARADDRFAGLSALTPWPNELAAANDLRSGLQDFAPQMQRTYLWALQDPQQRVVDSFLGEDGWTYFHIETDTGPLFLLRRRNFFDFMPPLPEKEGAEQWWGILRRRREMTPDTSGALRGQVDLERALSGDEAALEAFWSRKGYDPPYVVVHGQLTGVEAAPAELMEREELVPAAELPGSEL